VRGAGDAPNGQIESYIWTVITLPIYKIRRTGLLYGEYRDKKEYVKRTKR
jgi:hypothetical protein